MSLRAFQQAVVELTIAPEKVHSLCAADRSAFAGYDLTEFEWDRLFSIVRQPGIKAHCSLSRGNRFEVIAGVFPMTCVLLEPWLRDLLNALWKEHPPTNYQLAGEEIIFAEMVDGKIRSGELSVEYLKEVFHYEVVCLELARRMRNQTDPHAEMEAAVEFQHSPDELLPPLARLTAPPAGLPEGEYRALIQLQDGRFKLNVHHPET